MTLIEMDVTIPFKKSQWFDVEALKVYYGIKAKVGGQWVDAGDNNGIMFFADIDERNAKLKELKAK